MVRHASSEIYLQALPHGNYDQLTVEHQHQLNKVIIFDIELQSAENKATNTTIITNTNKIYSLF